MCPPGGRRRRRAEIVLSPPGDGEVGWGGPGRGGATARGEVSRPPRRTAGGRQTENVPHGTRPKRLEGRGAGVSACVGAGEATERSPLPFFGERPQKHLPRPGWAGGR